MANINQGIRSGNALGRITNTDFSSSDTEKIALKSGYLVRMSGDRYMLVNGVEPLSIDLWFTDSVTMSHDGTDLAGTHGVQLNQYGHQSIQAYYDIADSAASATYYGNILKPNFDSGFIRFDDLQPYKTHLYQLCPTIPNQPKFMDKTTGEWHSLSDTPPHAGGTPIGFSGESGGSNLEHIGTVSPKLYIKHPVGSPINVLDQAPEGDSGSAAVGSLLGVSGFLDGTMSPIENPNWNYSLFIEHGENNLPAFRMVVDCEEYLMDSRVRLVGWKYSIAELSMSQLQDLQSKGKVTYAIINPQGIPTSSSLSGPFMK